MSTELELVALLERFTAGLDQLNERLERGSAFEGINRFQRVEWTAGEYVDYDHGAAFRGVLIVNLSPRDVYVAFGPGGADATGAELILPARSWLTLPVRGSFVSVGGDSAGEAMIAPLFTSPEPALGSLPEPELLTEIVDEAGAGDNAVVAAVPGKRIVLVSYVLTAAAAVVARWRSSATNISGPLHFAANGGIVDNDRVMLDTAVGEALNLNLSGAVAVGGHIGYWLEP